MILLLLALGWELLPQERFERVIVLFGTSAVFVISLYEIEIHVIKSLFALFSLLWLSGADT